MTRSKLHFKRQHLAWLCLIAWMIWPEPDPANWLKALAIVIFTAGATLKIWAALYLTKNCALSRLGPYQRMRHPQYCGHLLMTLAVAAMIKTPWLAVLIAIVLMTWSHAGVIRYEESKLRNRFGLQHQLYCQSTPLIGWTWGKKISQFKPKDWEQARQNGLLESLLLLTVFYLILGFRYGMIHGF